MAESTCSVEGCEKAPHARGWCIRHYRRWQAHGDPLTTLQPGRDGYPTEWIMSMVVITEAGCWEWQGYTDDDGYGRIGGPVQVHRLTYERFVGPIPDGHEVDHLCRNRPCCNPGHLEAVTAPENTRRSDGPTAVNGRKTHCVKGHEFTAENTYVTPSGGRQCRTCARARTRAWKAAKRPT